MQSARIFRRVISKTRTNGRKGYATDIFPKQTMDDLPSPKGSWQAHYDQNQKKYNRHLVLGLVVTAGTLAFGEYMGYHEMYGDIPKTPAKIEKYGRDPTY